MNAGCRYRKSRGRTRGAAAVEFALTLPIFLVVVGAAFSFSLALIARFELANIADKALRDCILQYPQKGSQIQSCAQSVAQTLYLEYRQPCIDGGLTARVVNLASSAGTVKNSLNTQVHTLDLEMKCTWSYLPMMNLGGSASTGITSMDLSVHTSMPYIERY